MLLYCKYNSCSGTFAFKKCDSSKFMPSKYRSNRIGLKIKKLIFYKGFLKLKLLKTFKTANPNRTYSLIGSPDYCAPEMLKGERIKFFYKNNSSLFL